MAKFRYSMENILRIKERLEEQKRMELGQAMVVYQDEQNSQLAIEHKQKIYLDEFYGQQNQLTNGASLKAMSQQLSYYEKMLKEQKLLVKKALDQVEFKREALKKALEERKVQEKLKEHAYEGYLEDEKLKEQQMLDEVVGYRYATEDDQTM